jgi:hypothetical protein
MYPISIFNNNQIPYLIAPSERITEDGPNNVVAPEAMNLE